MNTMIQHVRPSEPLKIADRCDRCGAQAFVRVEFDGLDLLFCGHHYRRHEMALLNRVPHAHVHDERDRINVKPSVSANAD
ncbi:DUF7455 domain-containing protein [Actinomadura hibisca]|uniref:DUF7455 domain-containing protein n=1 Tax=Actinomadura hibisca TaxID=68565 RepID=UPI000AD86EAE|nr:hypothetical protein [Actinomadura hibisca]